MSSQIKTKKLRNTGEEVVEEGAITEAPASPSVVEESAKPETFDPYASINPTGRENDAMSGWRTQLGTMNTQYGGDILGFGNSPEFAKKNSKEQSQYYKDRENFLSLYNTVANYDADYKAQQEEADRAQQYADARRSLMEKYMPETLAAMGYANTGMASDAALKMQTAYDNYAINAQDKAAQNQMSLMDQYRAQAQQWETDRNAEKQAEIEAGQETYDTYLEKIVAGEALDTAALDRDLQTGKITEKQKNDLIQAAQDYTGEGITKFGDVPLKQDTEDKTYPTVTTDMGAETIMKQMKDFGSAVNNSGFLHRQEKFLNDVMSESEDWEEEMDGTLVDFNYGWKVQDRNNPSIYVFHYNPTTKTGEWHLTTLARADAWKDEKYKDRFFTGDLAKGVRGLSFYSALEDYKKEHPKATKS